MGSKVVLNSGNHYCRSVSLSEPTKKQGKKTPHKSLTEPFYANRIHKDLCNVLLGRYSRVHSLCSHRKRRLHFSKAFSAHGRDERGEDDGWKFLLEAGFQFFEVSSESVGSLDVN